MASQATFVIPPITLPATTVAEYVNGALKAPLNITLFTTPTQFNMDQRRLQSFRLTNRYLLTVYIALIQASTKPMSRNGGFGPLVLTWDDGLSGGVGPKQIPIGKARSQDVNGIGDQLGLTSNRVGLVESVMGAAFPFVAAPGTNITVVSPYSGNGVYSVNLTLLSY